MKEETRQRLERIEQELSSLLPDQADGNWLSSIIEGSSPSPDEKVLNGFLDPARNLIKRGGKRWRPLMMVWVAEMLGGKERAEIAYSLTPVVEYPHNGSLIVDDIEDGSDLRRGKPAVHTIYGTDFSINAGNLMYYLPTSCIDGADLSREEKLQVYQIYSKYLRRVHFGQGFDISWHNDSSYIPDVESYEQMCRLKTGCLAGMAAEIGAVAAGASRDMILASGRIAETMGLAFQIRDDVQNLTTGNPGKMRGDDIVEGKKSLPLILFVQKFPEKRDDLIEIMRSVQQEAENHADASALQDQIEKAVRMMEKAGVIAEAKSRAGRLFDDVINEMEMLYPASGAKEEMLAMFQGFRG
ncbi:MAG: polyprenyl synthetase family protein [Spirochaetales bacterium]|nr:polyprenyl synthetase family protein [Spirochaetales bacterium]